MKYTLSVVCFAWLACGQAPTALQGPAGTNGVDGQRGIAGTQGVQGTQGVMGATGVQGATGQGLAYSSRSSCSFFSASLGLTFAYQAVSFTNGVQWAQCSVTGSSYEASNSVYLSSSTTFACNTTYDIDVSSGGYWSFAWLGSTHLAQAVYHDIGSSNDTTTIYFNTGDCVIN